LKTSQLLYVTSVASNTEERSTNYLAYDTEKRPTDDPEERPADDPRGENDKTEYVGVDDEPIEPSSNNGFDYIANIDEQDNDDCIVDDEKDCEVVEQQTAQRRRKQRPVQVHLKEKRPRR
jgi:hypothetical protein